MHLRTNLRKRKRTIPMELKCKIIFDEEKLQEMVEQAVANLIEQGYIWREYTPEELNVEDENDFES